MFFLTCVATFKTIHTPTSGLHIAFGFSASVAGNPEVADGADGVTPGGQAAPMHGCVPQSLSRARPRAENKSVRNGPATIVDQLRSLELQEPGAAAAAVYDQPVALRPLHEDPASGETIEVTEADHRPSPRRC